MTSRTTLVDGVRTHTLWIPKDTIAMGDAVISDQEALEKLRADLTTPEESVGDKEK